MHYINIVLFPSYLAKLRYCQIEVIWVFPFLYGFRVTWDADTAHKEASLESVHCLICICANSLCGYGIVSF